MHSHVPFDRNLQAHKQRFDGEELAYIAALMRGLDVVYGDEPRGETYLRLDEDLSVYDLDHAYGTQVSPHRQRNTQQQGCSGMLQVYKLQVNPRS